MSIEKIYKLDSSYFVTTVYLRIYSINYCTVYTVYTILFTILHTIV